MKRITKVIAIFMAMCLVLCACGEKKEESEKKDYSHYANYNYSEGIDDNGYFAGVKATDYVTLPSLDKITISKEEVQDEIDKILSDRQYMKSSKNDSESRILVDGDTVNIDYIGKIDGVPFDNGSTNGQGTEVTIGVTNYIDDFLQQLIGHHPGETFNVEVTFPDDYGVESLNGKDAVFVTTINYAMDYEQYELTDEFVQTVFMDQYGWNSIEDLKKGIAGSFAENKVYTDTKFADKLPEVVEDSFVGRTLADLYYQATAYQLDPDTFAQYQFGSYGVTSFAQIESVYESYKSIGAQEFLFYQAVAETAGIKIDDNALKEYCANYGISDEDYALELEDYGKPYIVSMALYDKAVQYIYSLAEIEE